MDGALESGAKRLTNAALIFFAAVGFIASVVTVLTYLNPAEVSSLNVKVTPGYFRIPEYAAGLTKEKSSAKDLINGLEGEFCKGFTINELAGKNDAYIEKMKSETKIRSDAKLCRDIHQVEFVLRWSAAFADSPGTLYEMSIENDGTKVAQKIRLSSENVNAVQVKRGSDYLDTEKNHSEEYYELPDLNPREKFTILVWTNISNYDLDYWNTQSVPNITFSGSKVHTEYMRHVPDGWWGMYDAYEDMPIIIVVAITILASFFISFGAILVIAIPTALINGKPVSSVFNNKKPEENPSDQI